MLRVAVSMLSVASCLGDSIGNKRLAGQVGLVEKAESRAAALAGFQKFADGLVAQYMADGKEIDNTTKQAINTVITYIDSFYNTSDLEHGIDVGRVDSCPGAIESCVSDHLPEDTVSKIQTLKEETNKLRDVHKGCRTAEVSCPTVINSACHLYDTQRANYHSLPVCVGSGHLGDDYIRADADDLPAPNDLQRMEECLELFKEWFDPLYQYYKDCKRGTDECPVPPPANQCHGEQWNFEAEHCELTMAVENACTNYQECETRENARCGAEGTVCSEIAINVGARKADNETGERIKCLLSVLVNSTDADKPQDLQDCVKTTYLTDHFDITCPARDVVLAPPYDCQQKSEREAPPCGADFVEFEYPVTFPHYQDVRCGCRVCESFMPGSQRIGVCPQHTLSGSS